MDINNICSYAIFAYGICWERAMRKNMDTCVQIQSHNLWTESNYVGLYKDSEQCYGILTMILDRKSGYFGVHRVFYLYLCQGVGAGQ